jgi:hypothetical protein
MCVRALESDFFEEDERLVAEAGVQNGARTH